MFNNKMFLNFAIFVATKKGRTTNFVPPLLMLFLDPGYGTDKNQEPESGINIMDPQHWKKVWSFF
jgi:hypothetical protein